MPAFLAPLIASAIPAITGLFGGKKQQDVKSSQDTNQSYSTSNTVNPILNPFQQQLAQMFTQGAMDQYKQSTNLTPYAQQGMQTIASQGDANRKMINNIIAQRGLSYSPAATTGLVQNAVNTGGQMSSFLSGIPLLARQLQDNSLKTLMSAFGVMPFGQSGTSSGESSSHMTGTNVQSGNPTAGFFGGLGAGMFAPNGNTGQSNIGSIIDSIWNKPKKVQTSPGVTSSNPYDQFSW